MSFTRPILNCDKVWETIIIISFIFQTLFCGYGRYSYVFIVASNYLNLLLDFDECNLNLDNCHEDAFCNNTRTHFECHCKPGFLGDGTNCTGKSSAFGIFVRTNHVNGCHFLPNILSQKFPDKVSKSYLVTGFRNAWLQIH